jgi:hypothetical protein
VVGYLIYYGADGPWKAQAERVLISTHGRASGGGATKILWRMRGGSKAVRIVGKQLDAAGSFRQQFPATPSGGDAFIPSIINVSISGCWRITVSSGNHVGRFAFRAIEP